MTQTNNNQTNQTDIKGRALYMVQEEIGGICECPIVFDNEKDAEAHFIELVNDNANDIFKTFEEAETWIAENWGDYGVRFFATAVEGAPSLLIQTAQAAGYPYTDDLKGGCEFYTDEAFFDGENPAGADAWEQHPNANTCDTCDQPAPYMTCPSDSVTLYICPACAAKYGLGAIIEGGL
jgi:hypothetical protein